jgi:hypothetical protein
MTSTEALIVQLVNKYCSYEERAVVKKACTTKPERVSDIYKAELQGTPMCCGTHAAKRFFDVCRRALEEPS